MFGVVAAIYSLKLSLDSDAQSLAAAVNNTSSTTKVHSLKEFKVLTCNKTHTGHLAEPKLVLARAWFEQYLLVAGTRVLSHAEAVAKLRSITSSRRM